MIARCLACAAGQTEAEFCASHQATAGCDAAPGDTDRQGYRVTGDSFLAGLYTFIPGITMYEKPVYEGGAKGWFLFYWEPTNEWKFGPDYTTGENVMFKG